MSKEWMEQVIAKAWEDAAFKQELLNNPKAAIEKVIGKSLGSINIKVVEETANTRYLVLPNNPDSDELSDDQLDFVAGGGKPNAPPTIGTGGIC